MTGRIVTAILVTVAVLVIVVLTVWGALALHYLAPGSSGVRSTLAWCFAALGVVTLIALIAGRARVWTTVAFAVALLLVVVVWRMATPSNSRDWQPEVAVLPYAEVKGDLVTVHNIRNFDYRTETDFTPAYYDKTFDLRRIDGVDLVAVYWMGPAIAHLFVSFDFGGDHLAISVEARKDRTKPYATIPGFFRQYELVYIVADERDVIRVRTNYRKSPPEDVYLFRVAGSPERARRLFLDYIKDINVLHEHPRFYNTITTNCTTMILAHTAVNVGSIPYSWKIMLSGYAPEYAYERGRLDQKLPFAELMRRSRINPAAQAADKASDFSQKIRVGLP